MDLIGEERGRAARAAAWLDASRAELVGLAVLLIGATLATGLLVWTALGRPALPATGATRDEVTAADGVDAAGIGSDPEEDGDGAAGDHGDHGAPDDGAPDDHGAHGDHEPTAPGGGDGAAPGGSTPEGEVTVHVAGAVAEPGVVTLEVDARVADALEASGGTLEDADLGRINLARRLVDGEHVRVLVEGEDAPPPLPGGDGDGGAAGSGGATGDGTGAAAPVDLNRASPAQLQELPGIGPALADRIVAHRETHGPFREPGDLRDVSGIGETRFQELADRVTTG